MKHPLKSCKNLFFAWAVLALLPAILHAQKKDNLGKEFYVAFAENQGGQPFNEGESDNFFALFITSKVATKGKVEVPALGFSQDFTTVPGTITSIELPDGKGLGDPTVELRFDQNQEEQVVHGMAVHITSNDEIAVYGMNHKRYSSDAFMALPVDVLGTEYRTLNYQTSKPNQFAGGTPGEFWVVAIADTTNVTITPRATTRTGNFAGNPIKIFMNKGDVYLVQGDPGDTQNDLTGSLVESDQPIAVLSGHVRTEIPQGYKNFDPDPSNPPSTSRDHLVEQLPPVSAWGDSALVVRYATSSLPDLVRIVSSEDDNKITVNGTVVATLNAGGFYEIRQLTTPVSIQATSPILVGQYMHTSVNTLGANPYGDPAYSLVFPVEQFDTSYTFMLDENPTFSGNYINIVADPAGVSTMMLDGNPITGPPYSATFFPIPGSNYVYAQVAFDISKQGQHNIYSTKPFGITVYALGEVDSYSYPGGTLLKTITPFRTVDLIIDFGDRVMTGPPYLPANNHWDTTVYLQNISSDPYVINGFAPRTGDIGNFAVVAPPTPRTIGPGVRDSMTIEFTTADPNIRKHTKLNAITEHLRAYVVDVFGRGILPNAQVYSDSTGRTHVDTLDFGVLDAAVDLFKDSFVFVFNKGTANLMVNSDAIIPVAASSMFTIQSRTYKSLNVTTPYNLPPFNLLELDDSRVMMVLRFTPTGLANGYYEAELDINTQGQTQKVILIARVKTIRKSGVLGATFDTTFICQEQSRSVFIDNPNDFPVTVTGFTLGGPNAGDFNVVTAIPLVIPPTSRGEIQLNFAPNAVGVSTATAIVSFDLPKNFTDTLTFTAFGDRLSSKFWARDNIHILPGEETVFPIYARSPMQNFASPSFVLTVKYDPTYIEDYDVIQDNTLTAPGYFDILADTVGFTTYTYHTLDNSIVTGGSDTEKMALVYIKFRSHLNGGEDPVHFHQDIDINYHVSFDRSSFPDGCVASVAPTGRITLDSTCETVYLLLDTLLYPPDSYLEPISPNPASAHAKFVFDVPQEDVVHLDVIDMMGNKTAVVLDEIRKPGTYRMEWDATRLNPGMYYVRLLTAGKMKVRKMAIVR
ncbi:MAG: T9SS type A sorting domain-containing protein [Bacteroidota bacterium]|nr:T9SS type A sorting domain-containing protein [Bacteroidota bacterium]MDP4231605.1 T9SS type A sorting domain-containing protein [Bacteroidota bacterium]MDP4234850.1 T9SS type A sorting domain-containing protein [Bacteroidota bacterium]